MTNAEKIRNMSNEELAQFLAEDIIERCNETDKESCGSYCKECMLMWLKAEVEE